LRVLVLGAGVIGSVYAGKLLQAGHEVVVLARGDRLSDLQAHGLVLQDAESGDRTVLAVPAVSEVVMGDRYDLVLVAVRSEQVASTLPTLVAMTDGSDVLFFGNTTGRQPELAAALGHRALFGFPAAGGFWTGPSSGTCLSASKRPWSVSRTAQQQRASDNFVTCSAKPASPPGSAPT
jgi:2-dehydropantoate 2-reductase